MKTEVSILHNDYPSRVRDVVDEKLQRLVKFCGWTISMRALCERQNDDHRVEIVANAGGGTVLVADARAALDYLSGEPQVMADNLGIWGTSFGGALSLEVATHDDVVSCIRERLWTI